jgi:Flp pilus assembly protein TadB
MFVKEFINAAKTLFDPNKRKETPPALKIDLKIIFRLLTLIWALALLTFFMLHLAGVIDLTLVFVCIAGIIIGVLFLLWEAFNRKTYFK